MGWRLEFATAAEADFALIFDHLFESYLEFGESRAEAFDHAVARVFQIRADAERILAAPHRGARQDDILLGARNVTIGKASYWFRVDDTERIVTVLAVFFGAQDQRRRMLVRLLER